MKHLAIIATLIAAFGLTTCSRDKEKPKPKYTHGCYDNTSCKGQPFREFMNVDDCKKTLKQLKRTGSWREYTNLRNWQNHLVCRAINSDGSYIFHGKGGCFTKPDCKGKPLPNTYIYSYCKVALKRLKISGSYRDNEGAICVNFNDPKLPNLKIPPKKEHTQRMTKEEHDAHVERVSNNLLAFLLIVPALEAQMAKKKFCHQKNHPKCKAALAMLDAMDKKVKSMSKPW